MSATPISVSRLTLTDFRNYARHTLETDARPVVLTGANGAGKTNLLEAVSLLVPGRGLRRASFETLARAGGSGGWAVAAEVDGLLGNVRIGTGIEAGQTGSARSVRIEREPSPVTALGDHVAALWLTPAMDGLFTGPSSDRRRFLDRLTVALEPGHAAQTARFEKLMRQRNKLLDAERPDARWLDAVETEMAGAGVAVAAARRETVVRLSATQADRGSDDLFPAFAIVIEGELEAALEETSATAVEDSYREQLAAMRRQDAAAGRTLAGPHRSDLAVTHLGKGIAAALASTGEQKALLIGLTLAHADIVSRAEGRERPPILLLDEIAAHLDDLRRAALYERLLDLECQAWMTGTDRALFTAISDAAQLFEIAGGMVQPWD
ncbi:MAG: DNA replication/repair protein RecF [Rhodobiaceae bacterium]|nr:DNA replication/repair protein RecF [Rhodobiaceae bacterium]MCC0012686.1 DNA replication/repair protein RecF [Rhodobiaceae bacterium]MCC0018007.1 DNA replication/repair protein RecF [Rhodobiaceae bacterium]MCC0062041.1 DNA replication/repair protein RecF [Rhodobiaceae bacterium]